MSLEKDLRRILMKLRKSKLIEENLLLDRLNELDKAFIDQNVTLSSPLLAMIQIVNYNDTVQNLDEDIDQIEKEIELIISSWEKKSLADDAARAQISKLVESNQFNITLKEKLILMINDKIKDLCLRIAEAGVNPDEFFSFSNSKAQSGEENNIQQAFHAIWQQHKLNQIAETKGVHPPESLRRIESDILEAFLTPLSEHNQVKFQLDELIKPLPDIMKKQPLVQSPSSLEEISETSEQLIAEAEQPMESQDFWNPVGKIAYNSQKKPIGLIRAPIQVHDQIFFPVVIEESISFSRIKTKYSAPFRSINIDLNSDSTEEIQKVIAQALNIPPQMSFQPSFFNKWLSTHTNEIVPEKPRIVNVWFLNATKLQETDQGLITIDEKLLDKISLTAWIPAPSLSPSFPISEGDSVEGIGGTHFGIISGILTQSPFGHSVIVNRPIPPSSVLDIYLEGLNKQNLAELRFFLAKKLQIGEGEVFSANNLWKINYQERLLLSPHELAIAYYALVPSQAFQMEEGLKAKIGIYYHSISESLRYLIGKNIYKDNNRVGTIYGLKLINNQLFILYSSLSADQLVQQVGRKHSHHHLDRFQKRIALALAIPENESLKPNNLAIYYLNFIFPMKEEFNSLENSMSAVESQFALKPLSFSTFHSVTEEGLFC